MAFQIRSPTEGGSRGVRGQRHRYGDRPARSGRRGQGGSAPGGVRGSAPSKTVYDLENGATYLLLEVNDLTDEAG